MSAFWRRRPRKPTRADASLALPDAIQMLAVSPGERAEAEVARAPRAPRLVVSAGRGLGMAARTQMPAWRRVGAARPVEETLLAEAAAAARPDAQGRPVEMVTSTPAKLATVTARHRARRPWAVCVAH
jgi:hypothetical protein